MPSAVGTFNADVGGGTQVISWSGPDFTPNALRLFTQNETLNITRADRGASFSEGWTDGTTVFSIALHHEDGVGTTNCRRRQSKSKLLTCVSESGDIVGECTFTSFGNKQFTIEWTNTPDNVWQIHYQAIEVKNVNLVIEPAKTSTGSQTVSHAAFTGNIAMAMGVDLLASQLDEWVDDLEYFCGYSLPVVCSISSEDGATTSNDNRGVVSTDFVRSIGYSGAPEELYAAGVPTFASGEFSMTWSNAAAAANDIAYFVFEFDDAESGSDTNPASDSTENTISGLAFTPNGLMTATVQTASGYTADCALGIGVADGESSEKNAQCGFYSSDGQATTQVSTTENNLYAVRMALHDASQRASGIVTDYSSGNVEITWTDVNGERQFSWLAFSATSAADVPEVGDVGPSLIIGSNMLG